MKVLSGILYSLRRHKLGAFSLLHWLSIICLGLAALITTAQFEIHRFWSSPFLLLSVAIPVLDGLAARGNYVSFTPVHQDLEVTRLSPQTQLSVRATGLFEVEGRFRRHTWLEASYRTFPSREHAVIAVCQPSTLLRVAHSSVLDNGMWYIFCQPSSIRKVQVGHVQFGQLLKPAVAFAHVLELPVRLRRNRTRLRETIVYLSFEKTADALVVASDLLAESALQNTFKK